MLFLSGVPLTFCLSTLPPPLLIPLIEESRGKGRLGAVPPLRLVQVLCTEYRYRLPLAWTVLDGAMPNDVTVRLLHGRSIGLTWGSIVCVWFFQKHSMQAKSPLLLLAA